MRLCNTDPQINCFTFSHLYVVVQLVWIAAFLVSIFAINSNIEIGGNYYEENQSSGLLPVLYTGHDR